MINYFLMLGSGIKAVILLLIGLSVLDFVLLYLDFAQAMIALLACFLCANC